jgi:hypothetical protein
MKETKGPNGECNSIVQLYSLTTVQPIIIRVPLGKKYKDEGKAGTSVAGSNPVELVK